MKSRDFSKYIFLLLVPVAILYYIFILIKKKNLAIPVEKFDTLETSMPKDSEEIITPNGFNKRQLDIIKYLENGESGKVSELLKLFPGVTDRTLRRDFNKLEILGVVKKSGSTKSATYTLLK